MSNESTLLNLDRLAAQHAQAIMRITVGNHVVEEDEQKKIAGSMDNTVTKTLSVLQENGVYACFLYLLAKEKENGDVVVDQMLELLNNLGFDWGKPADNSAEKVLNYITEKVTVNLERLLLTKETLEQMLIYARYGAKACGQGGAP